MEVRQNSTAPIKVFIVEFSSVAREGLRLFVNRSDEVTVVGDSETPEGVLSHPALGIADLIIWDDSLQQPEGVLCVEQIMARYHRIYILHLSSTGRSNIHNVFSVGSIGVIDKSASPSELIAAIKSSVAGVLPMTSAVCGELVSIIRRGRPLATDRLDESPRAPRKPKGDAERRSLSGGARLFRSTRHTVSAFLHRTGGPAPQQR